MHRAPLPPVFARVTRFAFFLGIAALPLGAEPAPGNFPRSIEERVHQLVNSTRREKNLPKLEWDDALAGVARRHSEDMAARGYFGHTGPDDREPIDRVRAAGIVQDDRFEQIGENIFQISVVASIRTVVENGQQRTETREYSAGRIADKTLNGWMASPGHRRNLVNPRFDRQGVGVAISTDRVVYITQVLLKVRP